MPNYSLVKDAGVTVKRLVVNSLTFAALLTGIDAYSVDFSGYVGGQQRWFYDTAVAAGQASTPTALSLELEWYQTVNDGQDGIVFKPFFRVDSDDDERSHVDIRELYWLHVTDDWELGVGISKVYWGVAESQHLVDVINQTDLVEAPDGEEKLGQPMLRWSTNRAWGVVDVFVLPGFRPRTFSGNDGRLRPEWLIDQDNSDYESAAEQRHVDIAGRWVQTLGDWDVGVSMFKGTNREPEFRVVNEGGDILLRPYYAQMTQYGIDAQLTTGEWLWKLETLFRHSREQDFSALTGGFEYTYYGVWGRAWDVGVLMEYSFDSRDEDATSGMQNDFFIGSRVSWNDMQSSELLMGITQDLDDSNSFAGKVEFNTRVGETTKVYLEAWVFHAQDPKDPLYAFRQDSFVECSLEYYF